MKRRFPMPLLVALAVAGGLHLGFWWWLRSPPVVQGHGDWSPLKVRVSTVVSDQAPMQEPPKPVLEPTVGPSEQKPEPAPSDEPKPGVAQTEAPSPTRYMTLQQVDQYPRPVTGWTVPPPQFMPPQGWRAIVQLWVAADGHIDHVALLKAEPAGEWAEGLLPYLVRTEMIPASLAGINVPVTFVVQIAPDQVM